MKKILILLSLFVTTYLSLYAQETAKLRVAVFDPSSSGTVIDEGTKVAVRELMSSTFVNTGKYNIVERSLLEKVMKEQEFSNSGAVNDSQATEVGKLAGANKIVLSVVTLVGGRNMLSIKLIDVQTATIEQQKATIVKSNDLLDIVEPLTAELLGEKVPATPQQNVTVPEPDTRSTRSVFSLKKNTPDTKRNEVTSPAPIEEVTVIVKEKKFQQYVYDDAAYALTVLNETAGKQTKNNNKFTSITEEYLIFKSTKYFYYKDISEVTVVKSPKWEIRFLSRKAKFKNLFEFDEQELAEKTFAALMCLIQKTRTNPEEAKSQSASGGQQRMTGSNSATGSNAGKNLPNSYEMSVSVSNLIFDAIKDSKKAGRYHNDEERFANLKKREQITDYITSITTGIIDVPKNNSDRIVFHCKKDDGKEMPLLLFMDGKCVGIGTKNKGLLSMLPSAEFTGIHSIVLWDSEQELLKMPVDCSFRTYYPFEWKRNSLNLAAESTNSSSSTAAESSPNSYDISNAISDLILLDITTQEPKKHDRYKTDEDRFAKLKNLKQITEYVNSVTTTVASPKDNGNTVTFFCEGSKGSDVIIFLFLDGRCIGVGTKNKGLLTQIPKIDGMHSISLWCDDDKILKIPANFSFKKYYVFEWDKNDISLKN
jgi:hypothetical protein